MDQDVVVASQVLHDLHKPWVFQWSQDGASRTELSLAGTGEHHPYSIAESIYRGLPAEICVAQACVHNHPGFPEDEAAPAHWIKAAAIMVGVDPKAKQLSAKNSFRNYVFSQATAMALYHLYPTEGRDGLTRKLTEIIIPA